MSEVNNGIVQVTLNDVYIEVRKLQDTVASMTPQGERLSDHENRLRSLEKWRYALPTSLALSASSVITGIIIASRK